VVARCGGTVGGVAMRRLVGSGIISLKSVQNLSLAAHQYIATDHAGSHRHCTSSWAEEIALTSLGMAWRPSRTHSRCCSHSVPASFDRRDSLSWQCACSIMPLEEDEMLWWLCHVLDLQCNTQHAPNNIAKLHFPIRSYYSRQVKPRDPRIHQSISARVHLNGFLWAPPPTSAYCGSMMVNKYKYLSAETGSSLTKSTWICLNLSPGITAAASCIATLLCAQF
jgi:hypothetical protein